MRSNTLLVILTVMAVVVCIHFVEVAANAKNAYDAPETAGTLPPERQFDFWLGEWNLTWAKGGRGTNSIHTILGGHIVQENFVAIAGDEAGFMGQSVSAYNKERSTWLQTWVDNQGGYLDFTGEYKDNTMILSRKAIKGGKEFLQRMVWHDITRDSLNWNWERSDDAGKSWKTLWAIHYKRKGGAE
jgi:hypothetical protein